MQKLLDHGYVKHIESWGHGEAGHDYSAMDMEIGIIEAARMSTNKGFEGWESKCKFCGLPDGHAGGDSCAALMGKGPCEFKSDEGLLAYLFNNKHSTPFEMAGMTIEIQAPIFIFREWHRHRTQSYNEMSARYIPMPNEHYLPGVDIMLEVPGSKSKQAGRAEGAEVLTHESALEWLEEVSDLYAHSERVYQSGLRRGVRKEHARIVVTVARYSRMRASANLRNWLAFLTLRQAPDAQWEIRQYANAVGEIIAKEFPRTWNLFNNRKKE